MILSAWGQTSWLRAKSCCTQEMGTSADVMTYSAVITAQDFST